MANSAPRWLREGWSESVVSPRSSPTRCGAPLDGLVGEKSIPPSTTREPKATLPGKKIGFLNSTLTVAASGTRPSRAAMHRAFCSHAVSDLAVEAKGLGGRRTGGLGCDPLNHLRSAFPSCLGVAKVTPLPGINSKGSPSGGPPGISLATRRVDPSGFPDEFVVARDRGDEKSDMLAFDMAAD
ncbi:MAG: hypothetical protein R2693_07615 [Nocardioidaceae bacterium]